MQAAVDSCVWIAINIDYDTLAGNQDHDQIWDHRVSRTLVRTLHRAAHLKATLSIIRVVTLLTISTSMVE